MLLDGHSVHVLWSFIPESLKSDHKISKWQHLFWYTKITGLLWRTECNSAVLMIWNKHLKSWLQTSVVPATYSRVVRNCKRISQSAWPCKLRNLCKAVTEGRWESQCWYQWGGGTILDNTRTQTFTGHLHLHLTHAAVARRKRKMRNVHHSSWAKRCSCEGRHSALSALFGTWSSLGSARPWHTMPQERVPSRTPQLAPRPEAAASSASGIGGRERQSLSAALCAHKKWCQHLISNPCPCELIVFSR